MKRALIIEDDAFLAGVYASKLERLGYVVQLASSVRDAVYKTETDPPHVIVLDIALGPASGLRVLDYVRQSPQGKDIPVIIVSNEREAATVQAAQQRGISGYFLKGYHTPSEVALRAHNAASEEVQL